MGRVRGPEKISQGVGQVTNLSPAAQAVLDTTYNAFDLRDSFTLRKTVAAALRTAALELHCEEEAVCGGASYALMIEVDDLLAIADELETGSCKLNTPESPDSSI